MNGKHNLRENQEEYTDVSNVETMRNFLTSEELPEGAYGAPQGKEEPVENKSTPWEEGQRFHNPFGYENKTLHQNLPRQMDGAHPPHDDPERDNQRPYTNVEHGN
ncbi:hypothetical protein J2S13_001565 [Oikeobacillus pervagus]|uniref:Cytosolic protein n=1 Tax=Oikeobacillus pervagus TaxID=1325931 RepID=A0AAJ1T4P2_9BACI|nr:cytosolic protein [Oikeobacillus pervagus]MDQ0215166.1 hypothetical protein [Oikeobacillus pervagus]